jgi:hypothetical protein
MLKKQWNKTSKSITGTKLITLPLCTAQFEPEKQVTNENSQQISGLHL